MTAGLVRGRNRWSPQPCSGPIGSCEGSMERLGIPIVTDTALKTYGDALDAQRNEIERQTAKITLGFCEVL